MATIFSDVENDQDNDSHSFIREGDFPDQGKRQLSQKAAWGDLDPVSVYYKDISHIKILTPSEEHELAMKVLSGDQDARSQLIKANLRLVVSIAKKYINNGLPILDLIEEGNLGLMKAVERFNPQRGYKLSTYATWWIKQYIMRAISKYSNTVRLPINTTETLNRFLRVLRNLVQRLGRDPTSEELALEMQVSLSKIRKMMDVLQKNISIENYLERRGSLNFELIEDEERSSPIKYIIHRNRQKYIAVLFNILNNQERDIIQERFGLLDGEPKTLEMLGKKYGLTRERIRQIEGMALKKLRQFLISHHIKISELL